MTEFCVALPLEPLEVGRRFERAAWPLHVTLVGNFGLDDLLDPLLDSVRSWSADRAPFEVHVEGEALFGPGRDLPVDLVRPGDLTGAHAVLARRLRDLGARPAEPDHWFDGYRPHVTRRAFGRARPGPLPLPTAVVAEIGPDGDDGVALVVGAFELGRRPRAVLDERAARLVLSALADAGVRCWVIGGWGVDALLGGRTRDHHDLDLFVRVDDLPRLGEALRSVGLTIRTVWSENRWIGPHPSAFVADGPLGEVDVHVVDLVDGRPVPLSASVVELPVGALEGRGVIDGVEVRCATAEAQLVMHTGYDLPARQREDVRLLRALLDRT